MGFHVSHLITDEKLARHVTALFMLDAKSDITKQMEIHGFTAPADYTVVANLMRELRSPPFDKSPPFTLQDVVARTPSLVSGRWRAGVGWNDAIVVPFGGAQTVGGQAACHLGTAGQIATIGQRV